VRKLIYLLTAAFATMGVALGAGAASAGTTGTVITPTVAGYYNFAPLTVYNSISSDLQLTPNTADATFADGQQLCNNSTGKTAGIGVEKINASQFQVDYGYGTLPGNSSGDPCLSGVLPATNVHLLNAALSNVPDINKLFLSINTYHTWISKFSWVKHCHWHMGWHCYYTKHYYKVSGTKILFQAQDLTSGFNLWSATVVTPGNPYFNEAGAGTQEPVACSIVPSGSPNAPVAQWTSLLANGSGFGTGSSTAVEVAALPASASVAELVPQSGGVTTPPGDLTAGGTQFTQYTVGPLC
jgi:hypothetical protein